MNAAQRGRRRALIRSAIVGTVIVAATLALSRTAGWTSIEERAQGLLLGAPRPWNPQVLVVEVDEPTLRQLGWPVRRDLYASVIEAAALSGAKVVAFDVFLVDPSADPQDDLALAGVTQAWDRVVLPVECVQQLAEGDPLPSSLPGLGPTPAHPCRGWQLPAAPFRDWVTLAHVNVPASASGYYRGEYALVEAGGRRLPALALAAFARGNGIPLADLEQLPRAVVIGDRTIAVGADGSLLASARGFPFEARLSLRWLISELKDAEPGTVPESVRARLAGKYVLVGQTAPTIGDHGPVITGEQLPLVTMHAALLSDLLEGNAVREPAPWVAPLSVLLAVIALIALALGFRPSIATALALAVLGASVAGSAWLAGQWWLVAPVAPLLAGLFAFAGALASRLTVQERERQVLRSAFGSYVDPAVLERVLEDPDRYLALGGAKKTLSVLFSDIKGYTGLSNDLPADQVVQLLREYLEAMTRVVKKHEGRVDKIMGDGIMAVFGDPIPHDDHALRAVTVGAQMLEEVARLQRRWSSEGKRGIAIRIGVATGEVFVGNIGSTSAKIEYTVLGPTVNLASRLEGKAPAGGMLVSRETHDACAGRYAFQAVQGLALKGFTEAYQAWLFVGAGLEGDPERAAPRLPASAPVIVRWGHSQIEGLVENVSQGGLYVLAEGAVAQADLVELEFAAAPQLVDSQPVIVRGQVRHVGRRPDGRQGFGVQIERADAKRGEDLRHFVALFLGPQPDALHVELGSERFRIELGETYGRLIKEEQG